MGAKLAGTVTLSPQRSQIGVVAMYGLALAGFVAAGLFLWHGKEHAWFPALFSIGCAGVGSWMWFRSHGDDAESTTVKAQGDVIELQTAAATINNPAAFERLFELALAIRSRKALPPADGLVGPDFTPLPDSAAAAAQKSEEINTEVALAQAEAMRRLVPSESTHPVLISDSDDSGRQQS